MRILQIISSVNPAGGGPIEGIKQLAHAIADLGHTLDVVSVDDPKAPWLNDFPLPHYALGPSLFKYGFSPRLVPWLRRHVKDYDAVIINGLWQYHSFAAWRTLQNSDVPYFVYTHGMLDPWFKHAYPLKHLKKWLYWPWADYRVLRDAKAALFTCEEERLLARKSFWLYRCTEKVVGYGIAAPVGNAALQREAFLRAFPALRDKRLFLFLSRIHPKKGCDILIESFATIAKSDPSLHLIMAGPDQTGWQQTLMAQSKRLGISARITWPGLLSGDMKWGAYHAAEAFVLPSHQENFGVVVAEALACHVPVIISNKVNIWREIAADKAGIVANDDSPGTVSALAAWLKLSDQERGEMRQRAVKTFGGRFEITMHVNNFLQAIVANSLNG